METCPLLVQECLRNWFSYPVQMVHCQVVTVSDGKPHVRTMGLYEITNDGALIFLTRTDTLKWHDLEANPQAAVCIVNLEYGQIVVEGSVALKTKTDPSAVLKYWNAMAPHVREIYLPYAKDEIADSFGIVIVKPGSWEVLQINTAEYTNSTRKQFLQTKKGWDEKNLIPV